VQAVTVKVDPKDAALCFAVLGCCTSLPGVLMLCFLFQFSRLHLSFWATLTMLVPLFLSIASMWAAWLLFNGKPRAGLIATIAWVLNSLVIIYLLIWGVQASLGLAVLGIPQVFITVHLAQRIRADFKAARPFAILMKDPSQPRRASAKPLVRSV
jgi:hypothetical protein